LQQMHHCLALKKQNLPILQIALPAIKSQQNCDAVDRRFRVFVLGL